jgi:hypothetical protein
MAQALALTRIKDDSDQRLFCKYFFLNIKIDRNLFQEKSRHENSVAAPIDIKKKNIKIGKFVSGKITP